MTPVDSEQRRYELHGYVCYRREVGPVCQVDHVEAEPNLVSRVVLQHIVQEEPPEVGKDADPVDDVGDEGNADPFCILPLRLKHIQQNQSPRTTANPYSKFRSSALA